MNFLEIAQNRYAVKKYDPTKKISNEKIGELKEVLRLSPSSINSQPWDFIFVSDEKTKRNLAKASKHNEQKINEASHLVVLRVISDMDKFEKQIRENLPTGSIDYYNLNIKTLPEKEIKAWPEHQVYLSLGFFLAVCAGSGIDSTPMEGIEPEEYDKILPLDGYKTLVAVAIGYRSPEDQNQPSFTPKKRLPLERIIQSI